MGDFISREAAIKEVVVNSVKHRADPDVATDMIRAIEKLPAADVRPVVVCADCKWFQNNMRQDGYLPEGVPEWECRHWCGPCDPTDFCSYGAKMGGEEE